LVSNAKENCNNYENNNILRRVGNHWNFGNDESGQSPRFHDHNPNYNYCSASPAPDSYAG